MILLDTILHKAINPALLALPRAMDSETARVQLLATGAQESGYNWRAQIVHGQPGAKGPARSFWQIERPTVQLVIQNDATQAQMAHLCRLHKVPLDSSLIHARIEFDDVLAAGVARLIYWADPRPLPTLQSSHEETWQCYLHNWRPSRPRRETWDAHHTAALHQVLTWSQP